MDALDELVGILSREKVLLERLLFRLTELRQLLVAGEARFLVWAADDLSAATAVIADTELRRALVYTQVAAALGLDPEVFGWDALLEAAAEPHRTLLEQTRTELRALQAETKAQSAAVAELSASGAAGVADLLDRLTGVSAAEIVAATGGYGPAAAGPARVRRSL